VPALDPLVRDEILDLAVPGHPAGFADPAARLYLGNHLGEAEIVVGAEHQVHRLLAVENPLAFLLRHTPCHPDNQAPVSRLEAAQAADEAVHLVLRVVPYRAGVEENQRGFLGPLGERIAMLLQHLRHAEAVMFVHLTTKGLYAGFFSHGRHQRRNAIGLGCRPEIGRPKNT